MKRFVNYLRDWRDRLQDIRGYFTVRREFALNSLLADIIASVRPAFRPQMTICFYPQRPKPHQKSLDYKLCALLGVAITDNPTRRFDVAFKRKKATVFDARTLEALPVAAEKIINARSVDISKKAVAEAFEQVFGYPLAVDPTQYAGRIVEKSDKNAQHDGKVLQGPIPAQNLRAGAVYQKEIDNRIGEDGMVLDYRLPIQGNQIPNIYLKHRPFATRFANQNTFVELREPEQFFSAAELQNILRMTKKMGLDYGALDVLRDADGRVYVVDVNNTPGGPPNGLPAQECKITLERLSKSFSTLLEEWKI